MKNFNKNESKLIKELLTIEKEYLEKDGFTDYKDNDEEDAFYVRLETVKTLLDELSNPSKEGFSELKQMTVDNDKKVKDDLAKLREEFQKSDGNMFTNQLINNNPFLNTQHQQQSQSTNNTEVIMIEGKYRLPMATLENMQIAIKIAMRDCKVLVEEGLLSIRVADEIDNLNNTLKFEKTLRITDIKRYEEVIKLYQIAGEQYRRLND